MKFYIPWYLGFLKRILTNGRNWFHSLEFFMQLVPQVHIGSLMLSESYSNIHIIFFYLYLKKNDQGRLYFIINYVFAVFQPDINLLSGKKKKKKPLSLYHPHYQNLLLCAQRHLILFKFSSLLLISKTRNGVFILGKAGFNDLNFLNEMWVISPF